MLTFHGWAAFSSTPSASPSSTTNPHSSSSAPTTAASSSTEPPALPSKPSSLSTVVNRNSSNYSPYNSNRYGSSPYSGIGGIGGYNSYSSPYSRFGGMGNSMYGGMGGYGTGYGSMYGGMGAMGGMGGVYGGMGQPGMMGADPNDPNSLTNTFSQSTQATFQLIESLVGAFGGVAQMLESTYMATHSSFFGKKQFPYSHPMTNVNGSYGIRCRTILQPPHHPWLYPWHFHPPPLPSYTFCKNHRPPSTRRRHIPHALRLRLLPRPLLSLLAQPTPHPLPKTPPNLPRRRLRSPLPNDQTHPLTRRPILPKPKPKPTLQPRPRPRRPTPSGRPTTS